MTLVERKALIAEFLTKCNAYADAKLADYRRRLESASGAEVDALERKIADWSAYRSFNAYTIAELGTATLDHWFGEGDTR
jgi:hypothetical protein